MIRRHLCVCTFLALACVGCVKTCHAQLKLTKNKENVVSSRLAGEWTIDSTMTKTLTGNEHVSSVKLSFKEDLSVLKKVPQKYQRFFDDMSMGVFSAGIMVDHRGVEHPYVLSAIHGNPYVLYFRDRDGDAFGNSESMIVMMAKAKKPANDLLFVGGDFNNEPFRAFRRSSNSNGDDPSGSKNSNEP